jgi:hypothetical protein
MSATSDWLGRGVTWAAVFAAVVVPWRLTLYAKDVPAREAVASDVGALTERLQRLEAAASTEAEQREETRRVEAEEATLERVVPKLTDERALVRAFDWRARELNLVVASQRWGPREKRELYTAAPLTFAVRGAPASALRFGAGVLTGDPLVAVLSIELRRGPLSTLTVKAEAVSVPDM